MSGSPAALVALVEWALSRGLSVTALSVGDCRIELMPTRGGSSIVPRDAGVTSMYAAYGGELFDSAAQSALGGGPEDLVPVVVE